MEKSKIITIGHVDLREIHLEKTDPDNLILLPVIDMVLFPGVTMPINLTRPESEAAVRFAYDNRLPSEWCAKPHQTANTPQACRKYTPRAWCARL